MKLNIAIGSYRFVFSSFFHDGSELGDKAIDDIVVEVGTCTALPGMFRNMGIIVYWLH